jgi:hypothetical protein
LFIYKESLKIANLRKKTQVWGKQESMNFRIERAKIYLCTKAENKTLWLNASRMFTGAPKLI